MKLQTIMVIYLDILGHKSHLERLGNMSPDDYDTDIAKNILNESLGTIINIRKKFVHTFNKFRVAFNYSMHDKNTMHSALNESTQFINIGFSDSFIIGINIDDDHPFLSLGTIALALQAVCAINIDCLSLKQFIRGGIDIGPGVIIDDKEIYGPALIKPYLLESHIANYPRIVIGGFMSGFINYFNHLTPSNKAEEVYKSLSRTINKLLFTDTDGAIALDYLGQAVVDPDNVNSRNIIEKCYQNAMYEYEKYLRIGDKKVYLRYKKLVEYFQSRINRWDITES